MSKNFYFVFPPPSYAAAWKNPFATILNSSNLKLEGNLKSSLHCFNNSRAEEIDKLLKSVTSLLKSKNFLFLLEIKI